MLWQENPRQDPFKIGDILFGGGNAGCGNPDLALGQPYGPWGASRTNLLNFCLSRPITLCSIHLNSATTSLKLTFDSPDSEIGSIAAFKGTAPSAIMGSAVPPHLVTGWHCRPSYRVRRRSPLPYCRPRQELRCHLRLRPRSSQGLQPDVCCTTP